MCIDFVWTMMKNESGKNVYHLTKTTPLNDVIEKAIHFFYKDFKETCVITCP